MASTRVQLALNVTDLAAAISFYTALFGVAPHKQRPGYANFTIADPPLKLVLFEDPDADGSLNHLGIEAQAPDQVTQALGRFQAAGLQATLAEPDVCCHATQDKVFVTAPDVPNGWWEYYTVTDDDPARARNRSTSACEQTCQGDSDQPGATCCAR
jgi:catechol 2,3-dioxygenase-like lactoylglutathione lyase family enzyme